MKFKTDSSIRIGVDHAVKGIDNQDYSMSGILPGQHFAFAIVSDGCTSGGKTDLGSRIIVQATTKAIVDKFHGELETNKYGLVAKMLGKPFKNKIVNDDFIEIGKTQADFVEKGQKGLFAVKNDLLATSIYGVFSEYGGFVRLHGDGAIVIRRKDGDVVILNFDWAKSMPFYPFVYNDQDKKELFFENHGGKSAKDRYTLSAYTVKPKADFVPDLYDSSHLQQAIDIAKMDSKTSAKLSKQVLTTRLKKQNQSRIQKMEKTQQKQLRRMEKQ